MNDFLYKLHSISNKEITQPIPIMLPKNVTGLNNDLHGILRCSRLGYIYNEQSKSVLWIKFLTLGIFLPLICSAAKCEQLFNTILYQPVEPDIYHDFHHIANLSSIAWKAVAGWKNKSIYEYMEIFALAEMDHQGTSRQFEMNRRRSHIYHDKNYVAPCMHPLFTKNQYNVPSKLCNISMNHFEKYAAKAIIGQQYCRTCG